MIASILHNNALAIIDLGAEGDDILDKAVVTVWQHLNLTSPVVRIWQHSKVGFYVAVTHSVAMFLKFDS